MRATAVVCSAAAALALDDGLAVSPPMGWRSWNQFGLDITQEIVEAQYAVLAAKREYGGKTTSLAEVGYKHAAIDDGWQNCSSGPGGKGFHNASGFPNVNLTRFPDMAGMCAKAKSLGIAPGWYENNCHCSDHKYGTYQGLVDAVATFGFQGLKMDRAGLMMNATLLSSMLNASGLRVLQENNDAKAHRDAAGNLVCPMHFFRTGADIRPTYGSLINGMYSARKYNEGNLTGPGCWAHADMLSVGVTHSTPPGAKHHCEAPGVDCSLTLTEMRTNFGGWCIISNPLILAMDLTNTTMLDAVWPIVTHEEAIAVNQQWNGDSGRLAAQSNESVSIPNCGAGKACNHAAWILWTKALPPASNGGSRAALFLMNNDKVPRNLTADFSTVSGLGDCGAAGCAVRNVWDRLDLPLAHNITVEVASHDSAFFVVTAN